jgi:hypothetical protein
LTSATSEGAQGIFSKVAFLKSVHSKEKDEACLGFLVKIFTKSLHRGGVSDLGYPTNHIVPPVSLSSCICSVQKEKKMQFIAAVLLRLDV